MPGTVLNYRCLYVFNTFNVLNRKKKHHNYPHFTDEKTEVQRVEATCQPHSWCWGATDPAPHPGSVACMAHFLYDDCVLVRRRVSLAKPQGPPASLELFSLEWLLVVGGVQQSCPGPLRDPPHSPHRAVKLRRSALQWVHPEPCGTFPCVGPYSSFHLARWGRPSMLQERLIFWAVHLLAKGGLVSSPHLGPGWTKQTQCLLCFYGMDILLQSNGEGKHKQDS